MLSSLCVNLSASCVGLHPISTLRTNACMSGHDRLVCRGVNQQQKPPVLRHGTVLSPNRLCCWPPSRHQDSLPSKRELVRGEETVTTPVRVIRRTAMVSAALARMHSINDDQGATPSGCGYDLPAILRARRGYMLNSYRFPDPSPLYGISCPWLESI